MSELHKFLFDGLPVRGAFVRLTDCWREILSRRAQDPAKGAYPQPVRDMLGEMTAAAALMQSNIKFDGDLVLQVQGDGPVKLAVVEAHSDLRLRATATVQGDVAEDASLSELLNQGGQARCAITLVPTQKNEGMRPYQGMVSLVDAQGHRLDRLNTILEHYMRQSEQLETRLMLAADGQAAAGLLIQRMPVEGAQNLEGMHAQAVDLDEHFNRIATLMASVRAQEMLTLDAQSLLHRLFWQENVLYLSPGEQTLTPYFGCSCSRERVQDMIQQLGSQEAQEIVAQQGHIEVGCDFCGMHYRFDAQEVAQLSA